MEQKVEKARPKARPTSIEVSAETAAQIASAMRTGKPSAKLRRTLEGMRAAPSESSHRTVLVRHGRVSAPVDEKIAPLVLETWRASILTMHSCEDAGPRGLGHEDKAGLMQVGFPTTVGAKRWLAIVCERRRRRRVLSEHLVDEDDAWQFEMGPPCWRPRGGVDMSVTVYFPKSEYPAMLRRLRAHNRSRAA